MKLNRANDNFEVVHNIERIREGANNMGNSNREFLASLQSVLTDLRNDFFQDKKHSPTKVGNSPHESNRHARGNGSDIEDDLKGSRPSEMDGTRDSG